MSRRASFALALVVALAGVSPALGSEGRSGKFFPDGRGRKFIALSKAAEKGDIVRVRALIKQGIDVDGKDQNDGFLPHDRPLALAAAGGHLAVVEALLEAGAKPDRCCCSCVTALHRAITGKHRAVVRRLLEAGASVVVGETSALVRARKSGDAEILAMVEARAPKK